jgi:hypothetical protein
LDLGTTGWIAARRRCSTTTTANLRWRIIAWLVAGSRRKSKFAVTAAILLLGRQEGHGGVKTDSFSCRPVSSKNRISFDKFKFGREMRAFE